MGVDLSRAGVSRGRVPDETAPKKTVDLTWAGFRRDVKSVPPAELPGRSATFVLEGSDAGSGVTEIVLKHGDMELTDDAPGIPTAVTLSPDQVAVSFISSSSPSGDWTATLQVKDLTAGEIVYRDIATFDVTTS